MATVNGKSSCETLRCKSEIAGLEAYFKTKGTIGYVKGGGWRTTERLAARGYVDIIQARETGRFPFYGITPAGEAAKLSGIE